MEFLKYVEDGQEHLYSVIERKNSNCARRVDWVTGTTPRHPKYFPGMNEQNDSMTNFETLDGQALEQ